MQLNLKPGALRSTARLLAGQWSRRLPRRISIATLLLMSLLIGAALVGFVPPVRQAFALMLWEPILLRIYEALALYRIVPILLAGAVFLGVGYYLTRTSGWKYSRNLRTIQALSLLLRYDPSGQRYHRFRRSYARWWLPLRVRIPDTMAALIPWLPEPDPELLALAAGGALGLEDCLCINPRYVAMLRAILDDTVQEAQSRLRSLASRNADAQASGSAAVGQSDDLQILWQRWSFYLDAWLTHWLPSTSCANVVGRTCSALDALDELIWTGAFAQRQGAAFPSTFDSLISRAHDLRRHMTTDDLTGQLAQHALLVLADGNTPDLDVQLTALDTLQNILSTTRSEAVLQRIRGRIYCHSVLQIERLIAAGAYQEAVSVASSSMLQANNPWLRLAKRSITEETWQMILSTPHAQIWLEGLLAEAWSHLEGDLSAMSRAIPQQTQSQAEQNDLAGAAEVIETYTGFAVGKIRAHIAAGRLSPAPPTGTITSPISAQQRLLAQLLPLRRGLYENLVSRSLLLGQVQHVPAEPREARRIRDEGGGWQRLPVDLWSRTWAAVVGAIAAGLFLSIVAAMYGIGVLPRPAQWIGDLRLSERYTTAPATSSALLDDRWMLVGTDGRGVQAYRTASGSAGLWHTYTTAETGGMLPNDHVRAVSAGDSGVWVAVQDGGLAWSDSSLSRWELLLGTEGFATVAQQDMTHVVSTPDQRFLAISTRDQGVGVYDTQRHTWPGRVEATALATTASALAFSDGMLWIGTEQGLYAYRWQPERMAGALVPAPEFNDPNSSVATMITRATLVAVRTTRGGVRIIDTSQPAPAWRWMVGEQGFAVASPLKPEDITASALDGDRLFVAAQGRVGQYDLSTRSWQTINEGLDGSTIRALAAHSGSLWAGTEAALYRYVLDEHTWKSVANSGVRQLVVAQDQLWAVTDQGTVGSVSEDGTWTEVIAATTFGTGNTLPTINDVAVFDNAFWLATDQQGVASYDWRTHRWQSYTRGLPTSASAVQIVASTTEVFARVSEKGSLAGVYRLNNGIWEAIITSPTTMIAAHGDAVLALMTDGRMVRWRAGTQQSFLEKTSVRADRWRALARNQDEVLIASEDGLLSYQFASHSWRKLYDQQELRDVTWHQRPVAVSQQGALLVGSTGTAVLPETGLEGGGLQTIVSADVISNTVWLSDGTQVAGYRPDTHAWQAATSIPDATIRSLRAAGGRLWARARAADGQDYIYVYDAQGGSWSRKHTAGVRDWMVLGDSVLYVEANGSFGILTAASQHTYYTGSFNGLDRLSDALTTDGDTVLWVAGEQGVGRYDVQSGTWQIFEGAPNARLALALFNGTEVVVAAGPQGLEILAGQTGGPTNSQSSTTQAVVDVARAGDQLYVVSTRQTGAVEIARLDNGSLQSVKLLTAADLPTAGPWQIAATNDGLWLLGADQLGRLDLQDTTAALEWRNLEPALRGQALGIAVANGNVVVGDATRCRSPRGTDEWRPCTRATALADMTAIADPFGRFQLQRSALGVGLQGSIVDDSTFAGDRIDALRVDEQGQLELLAGEQRWRGTVANGVWTPQALEDADPAERERFQAPRQTTLAIADDPWSWQRSYDPASGADVVAVEAPAGSALLARSLDGSGRWSDDIARAVATYNDKLWLGTQQGLWQIEVTNTAIMSRLLVAETPAQPVTRLLVQGNSLFAEFEGGDVWALTGAAWSQVSSLPDAITTVTDAGTGLKLFEAHNGTLQAATFSDADERLSLDTVQALTVVGDDVWLATAAGVVVAQVSETALVYQQQQPVGAAGAPVELRANNGLFARQGARVWQWENGQWHDIPEAQSAFSPTVALAAQLQAAPIQWVRNPEAEAPIVPQIGGRRLAWHDGRFGIDVVNELTVAGDTLWLATADGPIAYQVEQGLISQRAALAQESPPADAIHIARDATGLVIETRDGQILTATGDSDRLVLVPGGENDRDRLVRSGVRFARGRWELTPVRRGAVPIIVESLQSEAGSFMVDGRFAWDIVADITMPEASSDRLLYATPAGIIEQQLATTDQLPPGAEFVSWQPAQTLPHGKLERVDQAKDGLWTQVEGQTFQQAVGTSDWRAQPESQHFWPWGVILTANGWQQRQYDGSKQASVVAAEGLEELPTLFDRRGKFLWDNALAVAADAEGAWMATPVGLARITNVADTAHQPRHTLFANTRADIPETTRALFLTRDGYLQLDAEGLNELRRWKLHNNTPGTVDHIQDDQVLLHTRAGSKVLFNPQQGLVIQSQGQQRVLRQAEVFWPWQRALEQPISIIEDDDQLWIVLKQGLIRILR